MKSVSAKNSTDAVSCPEALRKEIKSGRPEAAGGAVIETSRKKRKDAAKWKTTRNKRKGSSPWRVTSVEVQRESLEES